MADASLELQKTIVAQLKGNSELGALLAGEKVHDLAPPSAAFPYISIGRTEVADWSTGTEEGGDHLVSLHIWSDAHGKAETLRIMGLAATAMETLPPLLNGHRIILMRLEFREADYDDEARLHHGLLRYRALVEKTG